MTQHAHKNLKLSYQSNTPSCFFFQDARALSYLSVVFVILFVVGFATGPGSIPWFFVTELFHQVTRIPTKIIKEKIFKFIRFNLVWPPDRHRHRRRHQLVRKLARGARLLAAGGEKNLISHKKKYLNGGLKC